MASENERGEEREGMEKLERLKREKWIKIYCRRDENKKKIGSRRALVGDLSYESGWWRDVYDKWTGKKIKKMNKTKKVRNRKKNKKKKKVRGI